jgi:ATP-dependent Zn protease
MSQPLHYATPGMTGRPRRSWRRTLIWISVVVFGVFILLLFWLKQAAPVDPGIPFSDFYTQMKVGNVYSIRIDGDTIEGQFIKPPVGATTPVLRFRTDLPAGTTGNWTFTQWMLETSPHTVVRSEPTNNVLTNFFLPLIPWLIIMAFIFFCISRVTRRNRSQPMPVFIVQPEAP